MNSTRAFCLIACLLVLHGVALAEPDLSGIWMLDGRITEGELLMTEKALTIQAGYDLLVDDPSLYCEPASLSRVWANPNVRIMFDQSPDNVLISYEFFDLRRDVPLGSEAAMPELPSTKNVNDVYFQQMGSSFAWYEDDHLFIETRKHSPGYIRTSRGIPQSETSVAREELWLEGETLHLKLTYVDEALFEKPFVMDHTFSRIEGDSMPLYECTDANYDWFEQLNAPDTEESQ